MKTVSDDELTALIRSVPSILDALYEVQHLRKTVADLREELREKQAELDEVLRNDGGDDIVLGLGG